MNKKKQGIQLCFFYFRIRQIFENIKKEDSKSWIEKFTAKLFLIFCPYCGKYIGDSYNPLFDIPESICCEYCSCKISRPVKDDVYVMYKIL